MFSPTWGCVFFLEKHVWTDCLVLAFLLSLWFSEILTFTFAALSECYQISFMYLKYNHSRDYQLPSFIQRDCFSFPSLMLLYGWSISAVNIQPRDQVYSYFLFYHFSLSTTLPGSWLKWRLWLQWVLNGWGWNISGTFLPPTSSSLLGH